MAKPGSTHVIEIETGIGEPAFIPLTVGQELQPISVGKKGMWRIESARVLDVHAFVYFDGSSLFVQSADESQPASVDGYRVGKAWTELHAPCHIEVGAARLRFRSLSEPIQEAKPPPPSNPQPSNPPPRQPHGIAPEGGPSTRVNPVDGPNTGPVMPAYDGSRSARPTGPVPQSAAPVQAIPPGQYPPNYKQQPQMGNMAETLPPNMFPPGMGPGPQPGMSGSVNAASGSGPYGTSMSGSMNVMGGGTAVMGGGAYGAGAYARGAPTVQTHQNQDGLGAYIAKYKELNPTKRLLVLLAPFCLIASAYLLLFDDDVPPPSPTAMVVDAGPKPLANGQPQCPPGFVPYPFPVGGQIPCVPQGTVPPGATTQPTIAPTQPTVALTAPPPTARTAVPVTQPTVALTAPPPPTVSANAPPVAMKTLERQAVDAVAVNDYSRAAAIYEMLLRQNPNNRVYAEAARILRQKADAGAPAQLQ